MNFTDYLKAKANVANTSSVLAVVLTTQQSERNKLLGRLAELDAEAKPYRANAAIAGQAFQEVRSRLLGPWQKEHKHRWPSATIYTYGHTYGLSNIEHWWARRVWLRVRGGHTVGPDWQWEADIDLYDPHKKFSRIFRGFGPPPEGREAIVADFEKHLATVTKLLEESGYIIMPESTEA